MIVFDLRKFFVDEIRFIFILRLPGFSNWELVPIYNYVDTYTAYNMNKITLNKLLLLERNVGDS